MIIAYPPCIERLAHAITVAEGSNPAWNNPGSLTYDFGFKNCGIANSEGVLKFCTPEDGKAALNHQVSLMLTGRSKVYHLTDTLAQVGLKYSGGDPNWAKNVAAVLNVPESTTLKELAQ